MVYEQEHRLWWVSFLEQCYWNIIQSIWLLRGALLFCVPMSRCFPFPPPGYEKKTRSVDVDTLKKFQEDKEKKHKREKEKEKREGKEKRKKDRSDGKHSDKKNKKEKYRDKKKHKEKGDKHESSNLNEKRIQLQSESGGQVGEKITASEKLTKYPEGCNGDKFIHRDKYWEKERFGAAVEKRSAGLSTGHSGEKIGKNSHHAISNGCKSVREFDENSKGKDVEPSDQLAEKFMSSHQKSNDRKVRLETRPSGSRKDQINEDARVDVRNINGQQLKNNRPCVGGTSQAAVEGVPKLSDRKTENLMERKEKKRENEVDEKSWDRNGVKTAQEWERHRGKDKEDDVTEVNRGHEHWEHYKSKESNDDGILDSHNIEAPQLLGDNKKRGAAEGNTKRKVFETNGIFHTNDKRANKVLRPSLPCNPLVQNEKFSDPCQKFHHSTSEGFALLDTFSNCKVPDKKCTVNGVMKSKQLSCSLKGLSPPSEQCNKTEDTLKPPHPDLKYLSKVLFVPDIEAPPDFDEQEWLLSGSHCRSNSVAPSSVETPRVWATASWINTADICALPYVIPY